MTNFKETDMAKEGEDYDMVGDGVRKDRLYADRDVEALGQLYMNHVMAMTAEGLHGKSAIAAELAWRDKQITSLTKERDELKGKITNIPGYTQELEAENAGIKYQSDKYLELCKTRGKEITSLKAKLAELEAHTIAECQYYKEVKELRVKLAESQAKVGVAVGNGNHLQDAYDRLKRQYRESVDKNQSLANIKDLVNRQADDEGLWFHAQTGGEAYVQQELRKLHKAVEQ